MNMHPSVERAIDEIDAAFFSGDSFHDVECANYIRTHLDRWTRRLAVIDEDAATDAADAASADRDADQSAGVLSLRGRRSR